MKIAIESITSGDEKVELLDNSLVVIKIVLFSDLTVDDVTVINGFVDQNLKKNVDIVDIPWMYSLKISIKGKVLPNGTKTVTGSLTNEKIKETQVFLDVLNNILTQD